MTVDGGGSQKSAVDVDSAGAGQISFLDQALWKQLGDASSQEAFVRAWLALQCRIIPGVERGVVVLEDSENAKFVPVAFWPEEGTASQELGDIVELALKERRAVVHGADDAAGANSHDAYYTAFPFIIEGHLYGVVCVEKKFQAQVQERIPARGAL